jgi:acyl carrier protein
MDRNEVMTILKAYICTELLNNADYPIKDDQPLITGGLMDSFSLAQVGVFVEDAFGIYIPDTDLTVKNMNTLNLMANEVVERAG